LLITANTAKIVISFETKFQNNCINNMIFSKTLRNILLICFLLSFVSLQAQTKSVVTHLNIEAKKNGAFVKIQTTSPVDPKHITGWTAEGGWFYITILGAISDSMRVANSELKFPVLEIQVDNTKESTQLAFKIDQTIENFEFYQSLSPPEILASLRFPLGEITGILEEERDEMASVEPINAEDIQIQTNTGVLLPDHYKRVKTALYLTGASLTIAGAAIEANKSEGFTWEIPTGLAIIVGTFIYDRYIYKEDIE